MNNNKTEIIPQLITLFILLMIVGICCLSSCKSYEYTNTVQTGTMLNDEYVYNKIQLDSALVADKLPVNFTEEWFNSTYVDYETNEPIYQYLYYKLNTYNEVTDLYKITLDFIDNHIEVDTVFNYSKTHVNTVY